MFRTSQHPILTAAVREAETLHRLLIKRTNAGGVILWIYRDQWVPLHPFSNEEAAEAYLFGKLPQIADTRGDIKRPITGWG